MFRSILIIFRGLRWSRHIDKYRSYDKLCKENIILTLVHLLVLLCELFTYAWTNYNFKIWNKLLVSLKRHKCYIWYNEKTCNYLTYGSTNIPKKSGSHHKILGARKVTCSKFPYWGPTDVRRHGTNYNRPRKVATGICAQLA
jgi:hypothetical protein